MDGLERNEKTGASFAYRAEGGAPWHKLGLPLSGYQTTDAMLQAAYADYEVTINPMFIMSPEGELVEVEGQFATARTNPHTGEYQALGTVKGRYTVLQNREALERALAVVGASGGDAVIDTAGVLFDGRRFFASIDLGTLVIDPMGVNDKIGRFLLVQTGHDGTTALTYANTDVRAVCNNTVTAGIATAQRVFKAKHTPNVEARMEEANTVLNLSTTWAKEFEKMANEMLAIPMSAGKFDRVIDSVLSEADADTDRKKANRDEAVTLMKSIYAGPKNVGKVGENGWAAWNAVVEYFDHFRPAKDDMERALTSMDDNSWVTRKKLAAQVKVLSLA
jgi:phage/plasmid-like protein (TIGR03299 family)